LSNSGSDPSSGDDECANEDNQSCSGTSKHSQWLDLDEQRLLAYKKEGKPWDWIFYKFSWQDSACNTYALEHDPA